MHSGVVSETDTINGENGERQTGETAVSGINLAAVADPSEFQLADPYLIVVSCPFFDKGDGKLYVSDDWRNDLEQHFHYIKHLILAAPVRPAPVGMVLHAFDDIVPDDVTAESVPLPADNGIIDAILNLPRVTWRLWRAIARCTFVHSDVIDGGHVYPYGLLATPIARLYRRFIIHFVENIALQLGEHPSRRARLRSHVIARMAHHCLLRANVAFVSYRESATRLLGAGHGNVHVLPYVYVHGRDVITPSEFDQLWFTKMQPSTPLRAAVFSRLTESKGIAVLLRALHTLANRGVALEFDVYGKGELQYQLHALEAIAAGPMRVRYRGTLPYDHGFLENLRNYHVIVIPSLSDEQPRILFDSMSQGTPVIASSTLGMRDYIAEGGGFPVRAGEPDDLVTTLSAPAGDRSDLPRRAAAAVAVARKYSIESNHAERSRAIHANYARFKAEQLLSDARGVRIRSA